MSKSQLDGTGLLVAVAAAALALNLFSGPFDWLGSICGLVLVFLVLGYDREGYRTVFESIAFAGTVALCLTVAATIVLRVLAGSLAQPAPVAGRIGGEWLPAIWLFVTVVFCLVDRARMSGRVPQSLIPPSVAPSPSFAPIVLTPQPASPPAPAPLPVEPPRPIVRETVVPAPPPPPPAPVTPPPPPSRAAFTQPAFSQPPAPEPVYVAPPPPPPVAAPPPPPEPVYSAPPPPPPPQAVPVPAGKEATIYVTLVGEGLNVLRAVRAEHLGRDYYKIVEETPQGELWQYGPGQVVRCKKKNLSSGKAMVAYEEAQRAR